MKNNASLAYALILVIGDFLAILAAFTAAYFIRVKLDPRPLVEQIPARSFVNAFVAILPAWILVHASIGLYSHEIYTKRFSEFGRLLVGSALGILVVIGYDFVTTGALFPARLVPVYGFGLSFVFLFLIRSFIRIGRRALFKYGFGISNVLIVGSTAASATVASAIADTRHSGQRLLGIVGRQIDNFKHYKSFEEAVAGSNQPIHAIIQTELYRNQDKNNYILRYAQEHHASYRFVPGNSDMLVGNIDVELLNDLPVIAVHQTALIGWGRVLKRIFDITLASILLIIALPFMLIIAVLLKLLEPRAPIFFRQTRLTRFNRRFRVYKFRTQFHKYDGTTPEEAFKLMGKPELGRLYRQNGDYLPSDPRITGFGRFLRRLSLDELPQLFNVIRGDLSLVGPRALVAEELTAYEKHHAILSVKSGLTGLAQISGRRNISFEERRKLDIFYVQNWSFWLDIVILLKTLRVVISGSGAK